MRSVRRLPDGSANCCPDWRITAGDELYQHVYRVFFQAEDGIRDYKVTGVQTCALPILVPGSAVGHVVTVDGGDDDVLQVHLRRGVRKPERLERVGRVLRPARVDVAVAAGGWESTPLNSRPPCISHAGLSFYKKEHTQFK